jgi:hypothetical protein
VGDGEELHRRGHEWNTDIKEDGKMIFARYRGPTGEGNFTKGKTYLARPGLDDTDTVDFDRLYIVDDDGERIVADPDNGRFEYLDEVYVALLGKGLAFPQGSIHLANEVSRDGEYMSVRRIGFLKKEILEILDESTLVPGMWVMDRQTGIWTQIERVDESTWIMPEGFEEMRDPEEFHMAVFEGDVAMEPLVRCCDASGVEGLTVGTIYQLLRTRTDGMVSLVNDDDKNMSYPGEKFEC